MHAQDSDLEIVRNPTIADDELVELLRRVYVEAGYTAPERATALFAPTAVRARGLLIGARAIASGALMGMIIVVPPGSPSVQVAGENECELHLLAVHPDARGCGLGAALVREALVAAVDSGWRKIILSTQVPMRSAQRIYEAAGFARVPARDWTLTGRQFLVYGLEVPNG